MRQPVLPVPEKFCKRCEKQLHRKRYGSRLEDRSVFMRRQYCSLHCSNSRGNWGESPTAKRREAHKSVKHRCEVCGTKANLHVHHIDLNYQNNLPENLQTLCSSCHKRTHLSLCVH